MIQVENTNANMNKKRVALLLFGQPRFTGNRLVTYLLKKKLLDRYATDVFACVWFDSNSSYERSDWTLSKNIKGGELVRKSAINDLYSRYGCENLKVISPQKFTVPDFVPVEKYHALNVKKNLSNILSQLYIFQEAGRFISTAEIDNYDFIVIARTDLLINNIPNLDDLSEGFYVTSTHTRFPDLMYILSPGYIRFANTFDNMSRTNWNNITEFIPELMKRESFLLEFPNEKPIALPLDVFNVSIVDTQNGFISLMKMFYLHLRTKFL
jgi:hypothetical protein